MDIKRDEFFKKCKDDLERIGKLIGDAGEVSVSNGIVGSVKAGDRSFPVYLYKIGDKEYRVSKKLHEYLVEKGCIEKEAGDEAK